MPSRGRLRLDPWQAYLFAAAASLATLAARVAFDAQFRGFPGLLVFTVPIVLSAFVGGLRGGLMATLVACMAAQYLAWLPLHPSEFDAGSYRLLQVLLAGAGIAVSALGEGLHRARARASDSARSRESAHALLRRDRATLANAQRLAGLGIWELDIASDRVEFSDEGYRIFGCAPESFGGTREAFLAMVHPDDVERVRSVLRDPRSASAATQVQYRIVRPDGAVRMLSQHGQVDCDDQGAPVRRVGVVMDVTERENALREHRELAEQLHSEKARLVAAQAVARMGSWETDPATGEVTWSEEIHRIFETDPRRFAPSHAAFLQRVHPDDRAAVDEAFLRSLAVAGPYAIEHRLLMADGRVKTVEERWQTAHDASGNTMRVVGTCQDISERTEAARAIDNLSRRTNERERVMSTLLSSIADMAYIFDLEHRFVFANKPLLDLLGKSLDEVAGRNFAELDYPRQLAMQLQDQLRQAIATRAPMRGETPYISPAGVERFYEYIVTPVVNAAGEVECVVGSTRDVTERKRAESALLEAENRYRSLFENSRDGIFQVTPEGRLITANPALAQMMGFDSPEEYVRARTDIARQGYVAPHLRADFLRILEDQGYVDGFEYELFRKDGTKIWISENTRIVVGGPDGQEKRYEGSMRDITVDRQAREALLASEEQFRTLAEALPQLVWVAGPDGGYIHLNSKWTDYTGRDLAGSLGDGWIEALHPDDRERVAARWRIALAQGSGYEVAFRLRRADGTYSWTLCRALPLRDAAGTIVKWFGTSTDIQALKMAEEEISRANRALRLQKAEMQVVFDLMPCLVWFKDTEGRIVRVNERVADSLGRPVAEIEGRLSAEIYPMQHAQLRASDLEVIASRKPLLGIVISYTAPDGAESWVQIDKVPYFDAEGKVVGIVVMSRDISERMRAEAQLHKTHIALVETSRLGGMAEVATDVLHNVGSVLNSINVSANLVVDNVKSSRASRMADVVRLLRENRDDLGAYITTHPAGRHIPDLLEKLAGEWVAQQEMLARELQELRGNVDLVKRIVASQQGHVGAAEIVESVALEQLVEEAVALQQEVLSRRNVALVRDFESVGPIGVTRRKVVRILVSLLRNARRACRHQVEPAPCITLRIVQRGANAVIAVSDNGSGIEKENLVRIFAPNLSSRAQGGGSGLHDAALTARELGGSLIVQSCGRGTGSTFELELPMGEAQPA